MATHSAELKRQIHACLDRPTSATSDALLPCMLQNLASLGSCVRILAKARNCQWRAAETTCRFTVDAHAASCRSFTIEQSTELPAEYNSINKASYERCLAPCSHSLTLPVPAVFSRTAEGVRAGPTLKHCCQQPGICSTACMRQRSGSSKSSA